MTTLSPSFKAVAAEMDHPPLPAFDADALPFVRHFARSRRDAAAFDWWCVSPSGDAAADFARGMRFHDLAIALARKLQRPDVLALIVTAIVLRGKIDSIESGFLYRPLVLAYDNVLH
jgi:hypothetical protein